MAYIKWCTVYGLGWVGFLKMNSWPCLRCMVYTERCVMYGVLIVLMMTKYVSANVTLVTYAVYHVMLLMMTFRCVGHQLEDGKVKQMAELLERYNSSYYQVFVELCRDVDAGELCKP